MPPIDPAADAAATLATVKAAMLAHRWDYAQGLAEAALSAAGGTPAHGELQLQLAMSHWWQGHLSQVHPAALRAAALPLPTGQRIRALGLAALGLSELGLVNEALMPALRALVLAREPGQHPHLPSALSCAAHAYALAGQPELSEPLHMEALSMARESAHSGELQQAYANLLVSFAHAHAELLEQAQPEAARAVLQRGLHHLSQARGLLLDGRIQEERQVGMRLAIARLLMLAERADEAEPQLRQVIADSTALSSHFYLHAGRQVLAELLHRRGRHHEALTWLRPELDRETTHGVQSLRIAALRSALACQQALALAGEAACTRADLEQALAERDDTRRQARHDLMALPQQAALS
ncbi:hypothetical protein [Roseateles cavernae]|uniref:hypothetical protein n=1 Tax=Roseateles cavernae TaxID=3153578 RepID=UPI0032E4B62A